VTPEDLEKLTAKSLAVLYNGPSFLRFGAKATNLCKRVSSILHTLCQNEGTGPKGMLSWEDIKGLVPTDDPENFLDKASASKL
jgi:hypothetical protein